MTQRTRRYATAFLAANAIAYAVCSAVSADDPATPPTPKAEAGPLTSPLSWPPGRVIYEQSDAEKKIRAALDEPCEFAFVNTGIDDVAQWIAEKYELHVVLDPEALAADGKGPDLPITMSGHFTSLANGLALLLDNKQLTYLVKHDVLLITTKTAASQPENLMTRLYQVHDLVVAPNDTTASQPDFDSLIDLISSTIRQQDWQDNGGSIGFVRPYNGPGILALIITHDERGHRELEQLLAMLRESRLQQIADAQERQPLQRRGGMGDAMNGFAPMNDPATVTPQATSGTGQF